MRIFVSLFLCLCFSATAYAKKDSFSANKTWVRKELTRMGLSKGFIDESLKQYDTDTFKMVLTLNLMGFMQPPGQHMNHVTPEAVRAAKKFVGANKKAFDLAEKKYKVPPSVISSLIWIETRHGEDVGRFHTVSVFLHLLQADMKQNREELTKLAIQKNKKDGRFTTARIKELMPERTKKKAQWAREQIIALAAIRKNKHLNIKTLRGSYAGAFGLPQFIPSSYRDYAKSFKAKATPNLYKPSDAIMSVAYYLSKSGWKNRKSSAKVTALMKYNNSRDYADSILAISKKATPNRVASSQ
ncbi:lytic murein transglycosylase [Bdellovibrio sp. HCB337]|uniref:lytic murein transglycosylase n=1 Tax=Bdellovibrio sp. HCB337 TaxID=3394358 RepID=UPI0039A759A4